MTGEITRMLSIESILRNSRADIELWLIKNIGPEEFRWGVNIAIDDFTYCLPEHDALALRDALIDLLKDVEPQP